MVAVLGGDTSALWPNVWHRPLAVVVAAILGLIWVAAIVAATAAGLKVNHWTPDKFAAACAVVLITIGFTSLLIAGWVAATEVRNRVRDDDTESAPLLAGALFDALGSSRSVLVLAGSGIGCLILATVLATRLAS